MTGDIVTAGDVEAEDSSDAACGAARSDERVASTGWADGQSFLLAWELAH